MFGDSRLRPSESLCIAAMGCIILSACSPHNPNASPTQPPAQDPPHQPAADPHRAPGVDPHVAEASARIAELEKEVQYLRELNTNLARQISSLLVNPPPPTAPGSPPQAHPPNSAPPVLAPPAPTWQTASHPPRSDPAPALPGGKGPPGAVPPTIIARPAKLNTSPPAAIREVSVLRDTAANGLSLYFVLLDADGFMTTAHGVAEVAVVDPQLPGPLLIRQFEVTPDAFKRMPSERALRRTEELIFPLGVIRFEDFAQPPKSPNGRLTLSLAYTNGTHSLRRSEIVPLW